MAYELLVVLLGGCAGAAVMVVLAFRSRTGQAKNVTSSVTTPTAHAPTPEPAVEAHTEAPVVASIEPSPAPAPLPALYETVQPAPAPVTYAAPATTSFGPPTLAKKPTRTYRRRTAPVRSDSASKKALANKQKKS